MAGISIAGISSGLDWSTLVDQLITADSAPVTRLQKEQSTISSQNSSLTSLQTKLSDLQAASAKLNDNSLFAQRSSTVSNSLWTVTAGTTAAATAHTIAVSKLASASTFQGTSDISGPLRADGNASMVLISAMNTSQAVTAGEFTVNGARVSVALTDTLQDVFQKINTATGGTVTASYNGTSDKMTLTSSGGAVVLGSANDTSNFLQVMRLGNNGSTSVMSAAPLGSTNLDTTLAAGNFRTALSGTGAGGNGAFTVNGVAIGYNSGTDTLRSLLSKINTSTAGVTASYDAQNDRIVLANNVTGDLGVSVTDTTGNLTSMLGLSGGALQRGSNAEFTVDGGATRTSTSNTLDETALGITGLSVTATSTTSERVGVSPNSANSLAAIKDFIAKFNAVQGYIGSQTATSTSGTKVTTSPLTNDRQVIELGRNLRSQAFSNFGTGTFTRLDALGIDFDGTSGNLVLKDETKLTAALNTNPASVGSFFTDASTGFATKFNATLSLQTGTTGAVQTEINTKNSRSTSITTQIATLQRHLDAERASLTAQFTAMETMQSSLKSQLASLNSILGLNTSTS